MQTLPVYTVSAVVIAGEGQIEGDILAIAMGD
jgi:hypothetical protein